MKIYCDIPNIVPTETSCGLCAAHSVEEYHKREIRPTPTASDGLCKQPNRAVDTLQVLEPGRTTAVIRQLIVQGQILLCQGSTSANDNPPSVAEDTAPQTRWRSRNTDLGFCVLCDRPGITSDGWCATVSVPYQVDCCDGETCLLCCDALQACPKISPQMINLFLVPRPRKTQRCVRLALHEEGIL
ncbi:hypothetical protein CSKR_114044 [Clonorchis sinensis]|uniref:Uncharacterized protein n=1 Tax=Clonorchis sinensis TaxID=79923 RepID=A0A419PST9_CLOSI|nr:hypothetical protein CSKR_114044 [Clonorchis sinensis]